MCKCRMFVERTGNQKIQCSSLLQGYHNNLDQWKQIPRKRERDLQWTQTKDFK